MNKSPTAYLHKPSAQPLAESGTLSGAFISDSILANLAGLLKSMDAYLAAAGASQPIPQYIAANGNPQAIGSSAPINQLSNTAIYNPVITGGSISGAIIVGTVGNVIDTALATIGDLTVNTISATNASTLNLTVSGTSTLDGITLAATDCSTYGNGGKLTTDANGTIVCAADQGGSGSTVSGSNAQVQFNGYGGFAASPSFTYKPARGV